MRRGIDGKIKYLTYTSLFFFVSIAFIISSNAYAEKVNVRFDTYPVRVPIIIDGKIYNPPVDFTWDRYTWHKVSIDTVVYDKDARYVFKQWSDLSKDASREIRIDMDEDNPHPYTQYIAYFDEQYRLLLIDGDATESWYDANTMVKIEVDMVKVIDSKSRLVFDSWVIDYADDTDDTTANNNTILPDSNKAAVVMDRSIILKPVYKKQYYVDVRAVDEHGNIIGNIVTLGSGWYYEGSKADIACIPIRDDIIFHSWRVVDSIKSPDIDSNDNITTMTVDAPYTLECLNKNKVDDTKSIDERQILPAEVYRLVALTNYGAIIKDELVKSGTIVKVDVPQVMPISNDVRYVFKQWSDGLLRSNASNMVKVDSSDRILVAEYKKEYRVEVNGNTYWYEHGSSIELRCPLPNGRDDVSYKIISWKDKDGSIIDDRESISITVDRPYRLECSYDELYKVSVISPYKEVNGEGFYRKGSEAVIYASESIDLGLGRKAYFIGWDGDVSSKSNPLTIVVDKPYRVVALWQEDSMQQYVILAILSSSVVAASIMYLKGRMIRYKQV